MMRAAVLRQFGEMPKVEDVPVPSPGPGEALVRVHATGLCATDLKLIKGLLPNVELPRIPGHEVAGVVVEAPDAAELVGRRVACHLYESCGICKMCRLGRETLCRTARRPGIERDGGLAEWLVVADGTLLPFSDKTPFGAAAVAMDAVATVWVSLSVKGGVEAGSTVAVIGCGGLGSNAVQIAVALGARVAVVDPVASHRDLGIELGAELAVDPSDLERVLEWSEGGVDVGLETAGRKEGFEAAVTVAGPAARIICNGYQPGQVYGVDSRRLVLDEITVIGSRAASLAQSAEALAAVERGDVVPPIMETIPLERVGDALEMLSAGAVRGRVVISHDT